MRVSVKDRGDWIAAKRLFKAAASQERKDLERLSLDRVLDRRVVQHRDPPVAAKSRER